MTINSTISEREEQIATKIVDAAYNVYKNLGPGLLENISEGLRLDVFVEDLVICELKAVDVMPSVYTSQLLTYLKLTGKRLGFLINFNVPVFKHGIKRIVL